MRLPKDTVPARCVSRHNEARDNREEAADPYGAIRRGQVFALFTGEGTNTQSDLPREASGAAVWGNNGDTREGS